MKTFKIIPSCTLPYRPFGLVGEPLCEVGTFYMKTSTPPICGIYKITSPSGKIYIGQSVDCHERFLQHKSNARRRVQKNIKLYNSISKNGWEAHSVEIIRECKKEELNYWEKYYVDLFQTFNTKHGLNLKDGGGNFVKFSDETKKKIGAKSKGRKKPEGWGERHSEMITGEGNGMFGNGEKLAGPKNGRYGMPVSKETRDKIRIANKVYQAKLREEGLNNPDFRERLYTKKSIYLVHSSGMRIKDISILTNIPEPTICHYIKGYKKYLEKFNN